MIRAGVVDAQMARVVGLRVARLSSLIFCLGAGLSGFGGVMGGPIFSAYPGLDGDMLPLMEFALERLWAEQENRCLTRAAYDRMGGLEGALARHADDIVDAMSQPEQDEVRRLLDVVAHHPKHKALLLTLYGAGLRISELVALDVDDVDLALRTVRCLGKGRKERIVPIGRPAVRAVDALVKRAASN